MVLIVESDPIALAGMATTLDQKGFRCFTARSVEIAEQAAESVAFDLILFSFGREVLEAAEAAARLRKPAHMKETPVLFVAETLEPKWIEPLHLAGGVYCLPKPFEAEKLIELAERAICLPHLTSAKVAPAKPHFANDWVKLT